MDAQFGYAPFSSSTVFPLSSFALTSDRSPSPAPPSSPFPPSHSPRIGPPVQRRSGWTGWPAGVEVWRSGEGGGSKCEAGGPTRAEGMGS